MDATRILGLGLLAISNLGLAKAVDSVWVGRADGSKQCEAEQKELSPAVKEQLKAAGIEVLQSKKGDDGRMRIQMCGAPSGKMDMVQIPRTQLEAAKKLGFVEI